VNYLDKIFYCYSKPLKDFLIENNERFIVKSIHEKTGKKYWVFIGTKKLNNLLTVWRDRK